MAWQARLVPRHRDSDRSSPALTSTGGVARPLRATGMRHPRSYPVNASSQRSTHRNSCDGVLASKGHALRMSNRRWQFQWPLNGCQVVITGSYDLAPNVLFGASMLKQNTQYLPRLFVLLSLGVALMIISGWSTEAEAQPARPGGGPPKPSWKMIQSRKTMARFYRTRAKRGTPRTFVADLQRTVPPQSEGE